VIFSVDMFNEGVDITSVDMVMFLRPTESPIVFLQQLGRGLRKCRGKEFLTVLDFIGNYEKAGRVRFLLSDRSNQHAGVYNPVQSNFHSDIPLCQESLLTQKSPTFQCIYYLR
jgi:superfamily II DNA or RNA helicase